MQVSAPKFNNTASVHALRSESQNLLGLSEEMSVCLLLFEHMAQDGDSLQDNGVITLLFPNALYHRSCLSQPSFLLHFYGKLSLHFIFACCWFLHL